MKLFPEGVATCVICPGFCFEKRAINFSPTELLLQDLPLPLVTSFTLTIFAFQKKVLSKEGLALGGSAFLIFTVVSCLGVSNRSLIPNGGTNFLNSWIPFSHEPSKNQLWQSLQYFKNLVSIQTEKFISCSSSGLIFDTIYSAIR